jgi:hypothetical protein
MDECSKMVLFTSDKSELITPADDLPPCFMMKPSSENKEKKNRHDLFRKRPICQDWGLADVVSRCHLPFRLGHEVIVILPNIRPSIRRFKSSLI